MAYGLCTDALVEAKKKCIETELSIMEPLCLAKLINFVCLLTQIPAYISV